MSLQFVLQAITEIAVPGSNLLFTLQYNKHTKLTNVTEALKMTVTTNFRWRLTNIAVGCTVAMFWIMLTVYYMTARPECIDQEDCVGC